MCMVCLCEVFDSSVVCTVIMLAGCWDTFARCEMLSAKQLLSATYLTGGVCAVVISLFVCSYTVYVVYINMRLTVIWGPVHWTSALNIALGSEGPRIEEKSEWHA